MSNVYMMVPTNGNEATVNGTLYKGAPGAVVSVASGDVAGMQAVGWVALTVRMMAPSEVVSVSAGPTGYNVFPDGTVWVAPGDVANLEAAGFVVISSSYAAPSPPTPITFTLQMQAASQSFQPAGGGSSYVSNTAGVVSGVEAKDVLGMIACGGIIVSLTGPLGTFTYTGV
jgi:hypothetical protein